MLLRAMAARAMIFEESLVPLVDDRAGLVAAACPACDAKKRAAPRIQTSRFMGRDPKKNTHCLGGQVRSPPGSVAVGGRMSETAIRPTVIPSITTGKDCPRLKIRGFP